MKRKQVVLIFLLILVGNTIFGINDISCISKINWFESKLCLEIFVPLELNNSPKVRYDTEQYVKQNISDIFINAVKEIPVNSHENIQDRISDDSSLLDTLLDLALQGRKENSYFSRDFHGINIEYSYPLFGDNGIISTFINHKRVLPVKRIMGYAPSNKFTGIVIYLKGVFNVYGKSDITTINASFFPKIYDPDMNVIIEDKMCYPESLKKWGMVTFTRESDLEKYEDRIGIYPLRIMAREIFGVNNTDILISSLNAFRILTIKENRELMRLGKILIIY